MADASPRFVSVCEEDLDKVLNDYQIYTKANTLFARDFYRVIVDEGTASPRQLSRDRSRKLII